MNITAIHLVRIGDHVFVKAEIDGRWVTVIKEHVDGAFSHIVEEGGMVKASNEDLIKIKVSEPGEAA